MLEVGGGGALHGRVRVCKDEVLKALRCPVRKHRRAAHDDDGRPPEVIGHLDVFHALIVYLQAAQTKQSHVSRRPTTLY